MTVPTALARAVPDGDTVAPAAMEGVPTEELIASPVTLTLTLPDELVEMNSGENNPPLLNSASNNPVLLNSASKRPGCAIVVYQEKT